jgi:hypothetical protein
VGAIADLFNPGTNEQSDAVRDLRTSYFYSGNYGVFLYGGTESLDYMDDSFFNSFYNADVNCDGIVGDYIEGLNEKELSADLEFATIIGHTEAAVTEDPSDGIVEAWSAQLANFYSDVPAETFWYVPDGAGIEIHTDLPNQIYLNILALDEADDYATAYQIAPDQTYTGYITPQATDAKYEGDYDAYRFELTEEVNLHVNLQTVPDYNIAVALLDAETEEFIDSLLINGAGQTITRPCAAGSYLLDVSGWPDANGDIIGYEFTVQTTKIEEPVALNENSPDAGPTYLYPNPASAFVRLEGVEQPTQIKMYDTRGALVKQLTVSENVIPVRDLASGLYTLRSQDNRVYRFVKQ